MVPAVRTCGEDNGGGPMRTALALADTPGVLGPTDALPAATGLKRPSAISGSTSRSAPGAAHLTLFAPTAESTHTIMEAPQTRIAAPTAESTSTMSSPLETRRLAPPEEPPAPEPEVPSAGPTGPMMALPFTFFPPGMLPLPTPTAVVKAKPKTKAEETALRRERAAQDKARKAALAAQARDVCILLWVCGGCR